MIVGVICLILSIIALIVSSVKVAGFEAECKEELKQIEHELNEKVVTGGVFDADAEYYRGYDMGLLDSIKIIKEHRKRW